MSRNNIVNDYFEWLCDKVTPRTRRKRASYEKLLVLLHNTDFRYTVENDGNRLEDGVALRYRFVNEQGYGGMLGRLDGPGSVLEVLVALAIRCEVHIMSDSEMGDQTFRWFWIMMLNLELDAMSDDNFDEFVAHEIVATFLDQNYKSNGEGGLFTIKDCKYDLRTVEIWYQMCWYLNDII